MPFLTISLFNIVVPFYALNNFSVLRSLQETHLRSFSLVLILLYSLYFICLITIVDSVFFPCIFLITISSAYQCNLSGVLIYTCQIFTSASTWILPLSIHCRTTLPRFLHLSKPYLPSPFISIHPISFVFIIVCQIHISRIARVILLVKK